MNLQDNHNQLDVHQILHLQEAVVAAVRQTLLATPPEQGTPTLPVVDGEKLRAARGNRSQDEVCAAAGNVFTSACLSNYERGKSYPPPDKLYALLRALNVTFHQVAKPFEAKKNTQTNAANVAA